MAKAEISSTAVTAVVLVGGGLLLYSLYLTNQGLKEINRAGEWWAGGLNQFKEDILDIPSDLVGGAGAWNPLTGVKVPDWVGRPSWQKAQGGVELIIGEPKEGNRWGWGYGPEKGFTEEYKEKIFG